MQTRLATAPAAERSARHARWRRAALVLCLAPLAACNFDRAITVKDVDILTPGQLNSPEALPTLLAGTVSNFQIAYSGGGDLSNGGHEGVINLSGLMSDELINAETFPDRIEWDERHVRPNNGSLGALFTDLARARAFGELASDRYNQFAPDEQGHAEVLALAGYAYVLFAEDFCSGVPVSTLKDDGTITFGDPLTRDQLLQGAIAKFDSALAVPNATARETNLARVGKGRALVDLGDFPSAKTAVAAVPTTYQYVIEHSSNTNRQWNGIWNYTGNSLSFSAADREGGNGLPFISANDPRVSILDIQDFGFDGETPFFLQLKYPERTSNVVVADGIEARLIEAEADLAAHDGAWLTTLNDLRGNFVTPALPPLADPGSDTARVTTLFTERAFWLYLTGHRLGDLRRLVRQYGRDAETVFPTGPYHKGGDAYGTDVNFPVVSAEQNNPNFHGCIDRNP
ncbi:MAG: hypothetical protein IRY91_00585 [Gemmatimonadaceae bacterium]|nr:hypothetical protein [Gemmatimonadaceae bacterium]